MNFKLTLITLFIAICIFQISTTPYAGEIPAKILQYKLNRIFLSVGEEANVIPGCPFKIIYADDTLYQGIIETSLPGVSISRPIGNGVETIVIDSCRALIRAADIDSLKPISIGIVNIIPLGNSVTVSGSGAGTIAPETSGGSVTDWGNPVDFVKYESVTEMRLDFEIGLIDAFLSFGTVYPSGINFEMTDSPAPFYIALIPNVSEPVNRNGLLTTSLYYRFDERMLSTLFDGSNIGPFHCLYLTADTCAKAFEFNPEKGRDLLNFLRKRPNKIKIAVENNSLDHLREYFADILSRDKIRVISSKSFSDADIYIGFVPLSAQRPDTSLFLIADILISDTVTDGPMNPVLALIADRLELQHTSEMKSKTYHLASAAQGLQTDVGVHPLFRPTIYLISSDKIKGAKFTTDGRLELADLRKILLNQSVSGENR